MNIGDIILCEGNGFISRRIKAYNRIVMGVEGPAAGISHVAMIGPYEDYVFEATTLNEFSGKKGVQYNPYAEWLWHYNGHVWIREQKEGAIKPRQIQLMSWCMEKLEGIPYENGVPGCLELLLAGISIPWLSNEIAQRLATQNNLHCSEADARVLKMGSILPITTRANKLPPCLWWGSITELDKYYYKPVQIK